MGALREHQGEPTEPRAGERRPIEGTGGRAPRRGRGRLVATLVALACVGVPAPALASSPLRPESGPAARAAAVEAVPLPGSEATPPAAPVTERLSDEWRHSVWAYVDEDTVARRDPSSSAPRVTKLRTYTSDDTPELVLALAQRRLEDGTVWVQVRLPMRPNNTTGWVTRTSLGAFHKVTTALRVDRRRTRATLYRDGHRIWSARVGIGRPKSPTPAGHFYVRERLVPAKKNTIYGVFAFGTSAYSAVLTDWPGGGVIGIHGTNQPQLIPGRISHGCIRVVNDRIAQLRRLMPLGTPIEIR